MLSCGISAVAAQIEASIFHPATTEAVYLSSNIKLKAKNSPGENGSEAKPYTSG